MRQINYIQSRHQSDMKKDLNKKKDWDWKQEIGMHFCGHVFSVVTDKYLLNESV